MNGSQLLLMLTAVCLFYFTGIEKLIKKLLIIYHDENKNP